MTNNKRQGKKDMKRPLVFHMVFGLTKKHLGSVVSETLNLEFWKRRF